MNRILIMIGILLTGMITLACPVCERQQPGLLRGITHGAGPQSNWDYVIVWSGVVIVLFTLFFSLKWLMKPGEKEQHHIKRFILNNGE